MPANTLPAEIEHLLSLTRKQQMDIPTTCFWMEKPVLITDHFNTRNDFYLQSLTVHGYSSHTNVPWTSTGVRVTDDFTVLMMSSAQWIIGAALVHDHDVITRIELPDGTTLTGDGKRTPWREALECNCNYCESLQHGIASRA